MFLLDCKSDERLHTIQKIWQKSSNHGILSTWSLFLSDDCLLPLVKSLFQPPLQMQMVKTLTASERPFQLFGPVLKAWMKHIIMRLHLTWKRNRGRCVCLHMCVRFRSPPKLRAESNKSNWQRIHRNRSIEWKCLLSATFGEQNIFELDITVVIMRLVIFWTLPSQIRGLTMRKGRPENNKMTSITSDEKMKSQQIPTAHFALLLTRVDCRFSMF